MPFYSLRNNKGQQYERNANFQVNGKYFDNSMDEDLNLQVETFLVMLRQLASNGMHNYILLNFHREGFQKSFLAFTCSIFSMPINYDFS